MKKLNSRNFLILVGILILSAIYLRNSYFTTLIILLIMYLKRISNRTEDLTVNYDPVAFEFINENKIEEFKNYIVGKYKNVRDLEKLNYYGKINILIYAIGQKNYEIVKYLLDFGFDPNYQKDSELPINYAIHYSDHQMVDLILKYKPDLELKSLKIKVNPLETAVYRNRKKIVEKLIKAGAKFSLQSYKNSTANELMKWENVEIEIKRILLSAVLFDKKKNMYNIYDKSMKKELNLSIFNTRHYFMENCLNL